MRGQHSERNMRDLVWELSGRDIWPTVILVAAFVPEILLWMLSAVGPSPIIVILIHRGEVPAGVVVLVVGLVVGIVVSGSRSIRAIRIVFVRVALIVVEILATYLVVDILVIPAGDCVQTQLGLLLAAS